MKVHAGKVPGVRFVEPDSGEVALLRPDITPQIARIVATRLQDRPAPWRLCYEGTIVRRRRGRARKQRQVLQCGIVRATDIHNRNSHVRQLFLGRITTHNRAAILGNQHTAGEQVILISAIDNLMK